jgi:single-strand DNA-binding protein
MSYNKVIMTGRLTRDTDLRQIPSGTPVCDFGIAVDDGFGEKKKTCFIDCTAWGGTAENISKWFSKGDGIQIEGRLSLDQWEDKNGGGKRSKHRVVVERFVFPPGKKGEGKGQGGQQGQPQGSPPPTAAPSDWNAQQEIEEIPF